MKSILHELHSLSFKFFFTLKCFPLLWLLHLNFQINKVLFLFSYNNIMPSLPKVHFQYKKPKVTFNSLPHVCRIKEKNPYSSVAIFSSFGGYCCLYLCKLTCFNLWISCFCLSAELTFPMFFVTGVTLAVYGSQSLGWPSMNHTSQYSQHCVVSLLNLGWRCHLL